MRIIDFNEKLFELMLPIVFRNTIFYSDANLIIAILKLAKTILTDKDRRYKFDNVSN